MSTPHESSGVFVTLKLAAAGDMLITHVFSPRRSPFNRAFELVHKADLFFANLEIQLGTHGHPQEKMYTYLSDPSVVKVLRGVDVDVVSLANNHMLDYGEEALLQTLRTLKTSKIRHVGAGRNITEASKPVVLEKRGVRTAFLSLAATLPLGSAASETRPGIAPVHVKTSYEIDPTSLQEQPGDPPKIRTIVEARDERRICQSIKQARKIADHVVVGIHWGLAFTKQRAEYQQSLGRKMIEAGATLIVGHHPHVRQGLERHKNGVILYSLGDFIFHDRIGMTVESGMLATIELDKKKLRDLRLWSFRVDLKTGLPILGNRKEAKELLEETKQQSPRENFSLDGDAVRLRI